MPIIFHPSTNTFHLYNNTLSYIIKILPNRQIGNLYFGHKIHDQENFDHLFELANRGVRVCVDEIHNNFSLEHIKQEFPSPYKGDMRLGSIDLAQSNGSHIVEFYYDHHEIFFGKRPLEGLPSTYIESDQEATSLWITLKDPLLHITAILQYTLYEKRAVLTRSVKLCNEGKDTVVIEALSSLNLDLPDADYDMMTLTGAWARERSIKIHPLHEGIQSIYSLRGHSSANFNPFFALKRKETTENQGEAIGVSFVYSGNFLAQVDVDSFNTARINLQIHPATFSWPLHPNQTFQAPEAILVYSNQGINFMSQIFHDLFRQRLVRGPYRDKSRPILINNWEGTYMDFDENILLEMAKEAKNLGVELFVLDDGWFEGRNTDTTSLGDWWADRVKLPHGLSALAEKINDLGLEFGLWIEPEMISKRSHLYQNHPDWILCVPDRNASVGRNQYVLDFSNPDVVDYIAQQLENILDHTAVRYIKWDMNRSMSEVYSSSHLPQEQGMIYHKYILGVYRLYERLIQKYPHILFESCASGGGRFDPGMLYYAPQTWTSDNTDAIERLKIQYGTSLVYPLSCMGSHVSAAPNHQLLRNTPLNTRANVAYFGTFGYELDPRVLLPSEKEEIRRQIDFMKKNRSLLQFGTFYRLLSPFENKEAAWMVVSNDRLEAIVGYYRPLQEVNERFRRLPLQGLDPNLLYTIEGKSYKAYGDELMHVGLITTDLSCQEQTDEGDYISKLFILHAK